MLTKVGKIDIGLFVATLALLAIGIVLVYSSSFAVAMDPKFGSSDYFLSRQLTRALLAVVCFMFFINFDYRKLATISPFIFIGAITLLIIVLCLPEIKGVKRWLVVFGMRFQVSDFARMALIVFLAKKCGEKDADFSCWRGLAPHYLRIGIICALVVAGRDFSTTMILAGTAFAMLFVAGAKLRHLMATALVAAVPAVLLVLMTPYRMARVAGFLDPGAEGGRLSYQVTQSLVGLGRGGLFGAGLGKGEQKYFYLPEPHTDFIIAALGEEFGFVGVVLVLLIFAFVVYRGFRVSLKVADPAGKLMAFGFTMVIALYALVHTSVATGLVPATGIPMPFLSYGGMSLIFTMSGMGILLNISSRIGDEKAPAPAPGRSRTEKIRELAQRGGRVGV